MDIQVCPEKFNMQPPKMDGGLGFIYKFPFRFGVFLGESCTRR